MEKKKFFKRKEISSTVHPIYIPTQQKLDHHKSPTAPEKKTPQC